MELNQFKDILFDLVNETDALNVAEIALNERDNLFVVFLTDGSSYAVQVRPVEGLTPEERSGLNNLSESLHQFAAPAILEGPPARIIQIVRGDGIESN